jgi:hypothetical protein
MKDKLLAIFLLGLVPCLRASAQVAQPFLLPFLGPTDPRVDPTCTNSANIKTWQKNCRALSFSLKDFTILSDISTSDSGLVTYAQLNWPTERILLQSLCELEADFGGTPIPEGPCGVNSAVNVFLGGFSEYRGATSLADARRQDEQAVLSSGSSTLLSESSGKIAFHVLGSSLTLTSLQYVAWVEEAQSSFSSSSQEAEFASVGYRQVLHFLVDWGIDVDNTRLFLSIVFDIDIGAATNPEQYSLQAICQQFLSASPSVQGYVQSLLQDIQSSLADNTMFLQGAPPEYLVLYDQATNHSITPERLFAAFATSFPASLEEYYAWFNQYDAGIVYNLPTRFAVPPPLTGTYTPGGNSCGVICLRLALSCAGATGSSVDPRTTVFANVMTPNGLTSVDNTPNRYDWWAAKDWINGSPTRHDTGKPFTQPLNLPVGARCNLLIGTTWQQVAADWKYIDAILQDQLHPLLLRTDLGLGQSLGGGHVILLVGKGNSPYVAQAYNSSGDYYIVIDPAGHYYANPGGTHYGRVAYLQDLNLGIAWGGRYAIYPKEALQTRVTDKSTSKPRLYVEGINLPLEIFAVDARSPVTLLVSDASGNLTGLATNSVVQANIPNSAFDAEYADEEEEGTSAYVTDGLKTVVISPPQPGSYRALITGTNNGQFTLTWSYAGGIQDFSGAISNQILAGHQLTYNLGDVKATGPKLFSQPTNQTVLVGGAAVFLVDARGTSPLFCTWYFDNSAIPGATNANLLLDPVTPQQGGTYFVVITNAYGTVTSTISTLTVGVPPYIVTDLTNQSTTLGGSATLALGVQGSSQLIYTWYFDGASIRGATNASLTLHPVTAQEIGSYYVVVSNAFGSVTSATAILSLPSSNLLTNGGFETGDFTDWSVGGDTTQYFVGADSGYVHSGAWAAELAQTAGLGSVSQTVPTASGDTYVLSFWLSNPELFGGGGDNEFRVSWNNVILFDESEMPAFDFTNMSFVVRASSPSAVVQFSFENDSDYFGLDDVTLVAVSVPILETCAVTDGVSSFTWSATPGLSYQVWFTSNLSSNSWHTLSTLTATAVSLSASFPATNSMGFYRIVIVPP